MHIRRLAALASVAMIACGAGLLSAGSAQAARNQQPGDRYKSELTLMSGTDFVRPSTTPTPAAAPSGALIHCNKYYSFPDANGTFHIQHACGSSTAPWGYNISPALCAAVVAPVTESGMNWTRNGVAQPRQAPHVVGCTYQFHGTFNPGRDYDRITYSDHFTLPGLGDLDIYGSFTLLGSPCSPTSC
jgi:hypothetical protein